jgi:hypothetical protein
LNDPKDLLQAADRCLYERKVGEALAAYDRAEVQGADPDKCCGGRWWCWMLIGDFRSAWRESDAIDARAAPGANGLWDGSTWRNKSVLIKCLHGFGDTVQFIRYAPIIRRISGPLTVQVHPEIASLIETVPGIDRVVSWGPSPTAELPESEIALEVMELPRAVGTTIGSIPAQIPYVFVPKHKLSYSRERLNGTKPTIGFVWTAGSINPNRSLHLQALVPMFRCEQFDFVSLQRGPARDELDAVRNRYRIRDAALWSSSLLDTAADISNISLVITVDTVTAHLAGALGRPVWLLLPFRADWRWMLSCIDSPWYPSMTIFRQRLDGEWEQVIDHVAAALANWRLIDR